MVKHEIKAEDLKAAELAIKLVFGLQEDETHDFIDFVTHLSLEGIGSCQALFNQVVFQSGHRHRHFFLSLLKLWVLPLNREIGQVSDPAGPVSGLSIFFGLCHAEAVRAILVQ